MKPESDVATDCVEITGGGALAVEAQFAVLVVRFFSVNMSIKCDFFTLIGL